MRKIIVTLAATLATSLSLVACAPKASLDDTQVEMVTVDGRMIENLHVEQAERALALATAIKELQAAA